jgi:hypothetical protein
VLLAHQVVQVVAVKGKVLQMVVLEQPIKVSLAVTVLEQVVQAAVLAVVAVLGLLVRMAQLAQLAEMAVLVLLFP